MLPNAWLFNRDLSVFPNRASASDVIAHVGYVKLLFCGSFYDRKLEGQILLVISHLPVFLWRK